MTRQLSTLSLLIASYGVMACHGNDEPTKPKILVRDLPKPQIAKSVPPPAPVEVLSLAESAFGPSLTFQGEALFLLTASAAYRVTPGAEPERLDLPLGAHRVLLDDRLVYWKEGQFYEALLTGGASKVVGEAAIEPRSIQACGHRFVWLAEAQSGSSSLFTFDGRKARELYRSAAPIGALAAIENRVYFTERNDSSGWRLGGISLDGGQVKWSTVREGRDPAMLAGERRLYFYDGPERGVRSLDPDLINEEAVA